MALHNWLMPHENVQYSSMGTVEYAGADLIFHITDQRIILHNTKGLIFKKEAIVSEKLEDISTMAYKEEGILFAKKGSLQIQTENRMFWHNNKHMKDSNALMNTGGELRKLYFEHYLKQLNEVVDQGCKYKINAPFK